MFWYFDVSMSTVHTHTHTHTHMHIHPQTLEMIWKVLEGDIFYLVRTNVCIQDINLLPQDKDLCAQDN